MTDARSPKSHTSPRQPAGPVTTNLRGSCQNCALSKVKCQKGKPKCSRCARRGTECEYFATKRSGRKRSDNSQTVNNDRVRDTVTVASQPSPDRQMADSIESAIHVSPSSGSNSYPTPLDLSSDSLKPGPVPETGNFGSLDIFSDLSMSLDTNPFSGFDEISQDFNDFFASGFAEHKTLAPNNFGHVGNEIADLLIPDDENMQLSPETSQLFQPSIPSPSASLDGQTLSMGDAGIGEKSDPSCSCLIDLFSIIKKLSMNGTPVSTLEKTTYDHMGITPSDCTEVRAVVADNQEMISTVSNILRCSCAEDGYLLTMLSMVVMKILTRYAGAAIKLLGRAEEGSSRSSPGQQSRNGFSEKEETERMAGQLVLSELHRVQRLVNELSPRLMARDDALGPDVRGRDCQIWLSLTPRSGTPPLPFSTTTLDGIGRDIRATLSSLSSEIISRLRKT
ncbi:trancriptional activator [Hypoxylon sp. NC1633]|nr:trancriptional activator [Hypoxylon sp. NC1633]